MSRGKYVSVYLMTVLISCSLSARSHEIVGPEPVVDANKGAQETGDSSDALTWEDFRETADMQILLERAGMGLPSGPGWKEHWLGVFEQLKIDSQENAPKYIAYIVEERRNAGLPDLEGHR